MLACMDDQQLPGMPPPWPLRVTRTGDGRAVAVHAGPVLLSAFGAGDLEMRDLVICSLTEGSRFQGKTVAAAFGIQPSQVSRIRSRYREHGARGLVHQMGRPPVLSPAQLRQARTWAGQGLTHAEIGRKLGLSRSRISELIKKQGTLHATDPLFEDTDDDTDDDGTAPGQRAGATGGEGEQDTDRAGTAGQQGGAGGDGGGASWQVARRIETGTVACRYAGAMLVHAFTHRIGAQGLLAAAAGRAGRPIRPAGAAAPAGQPDARHRARRITGVPGR